MFFFRTGALLFIFLLSASIAFAQEEKSRSPFSRPPSALAVEEPCRFVGTFHKESRQRIEELRAQKVISLDEWKCMARALEKLDDEMTVSCKVKKDPLSVIEVRQRELYSNCLPIVESEDSSWFRRFLQRLGMAKDPAAEKKEAILNCSLLSAEKGCF